MDEVKMKKKNSLSAGNDKIEHQFNLYTDSNCINLVVIVYGVKP
jgi:hypothetical protein